MQPCIILQDDKFTRDKLVIPDNKVMGIHNKTRIHLLFSFLLLNLENLLSAGLGGERPEQDIKTGLSFPDAEFLRQRSNVIPQRYFLTLFFLASVKKALDYMIFYDTIKPCKGYDAGMKKSTYGRQSTRVLFFCL